jgi:endo-1,4-beta-D-glucanase Y
MNNRISKKLTSCLIVCFSYLTFSQTPSIPFGSNNSYAFGTIQNISTTSDATAQSWYDYWKTNFTRVCASDAVLATNDYNSQSAYSEGQGYGLILAAYLGDKTLFDQLWKGYKDNKNSRGLMHWTVTCTAVTATNGATDGDLDAAMGLLIANKQWPNTTSPHNYAIEATTLINALQAYNFVTCNGKTVQKPGDAPNFGGCDCTNPSYFATGYYRAFAKHIPSKADFWNKAADDALTLLLQARNSTTGLNPAWTDQTGSITTGGNCNVAASGGGAKTDYQFDAARTPWRIVVDYLWWGTPDAKAFCDKVTSFASGKGIANIVAGMKTDGTDNVNYKNSAFTGAFAIGAMATTNQTTVNNFYDWWTKNSITNGNVDSRLDDRPYFQNALRTMYILVASGNFWNPYAEKIITINDYNYFQTRLSVYPNPFLDEFIVDLKGDYECTVSTISGVELLNIKGSDQIKIGKEFPKGFYILKLKQDGKLVAVKMEKM